MNENDVNQDDNTQNPAGEPQEANDGLQATGATQDKDAQRRGGEHSHSGSQGAASESDDESGDDRSSGHSGSKASGAAVDKDAQRRGGEHSHGGRSASGSESGSGRSAASQSDDDSASDRGKSGSNQPRGAATDKEAQRKGGQHSHGNR